MSTESEPTVVLTRTGVNKDGVEHVESETIWQTVFCPESSNVHGVAYDEANEVLAVAYRPYSLYAYASVPKTCFGRICASIKESEGKIGSFLRREFAMGAFTYSKLSDEDAAKIPLAFVPESKSS